MSRRNPFRWRGIPARMLENPAPFAYRRAVHEAAFAFVAPVITLEGTGIHCLLLPDCDRAIVGSGPDWATAWRGALIDWLNNAPLTHEEQISYFGDEDLREPAAMLAEYAGKLLPVILSGPGAAEIIDARQDDSDDSDE